MTTTTISSYGTQRAAIDSPSLNPPDTRGTRVGSPDLLPEPAPCGLCNGSIAELAVLLTAADEQDRAASRQLEDAADQAATREENDRVAQMRAKASADENQGLWQGAMTIAGGVATALGGFSDKGDPGRQRCDGAGQGLPGIGQIIGGQFKGAADRADADAARLDAQSQADIRRYNRAESDAQAANASIQKVEQFLDQIQQTENATRLSLATYRG